MDWWVGGEEQWRRRKRSTEINTGSVFSCTIQGMVPHQITWMSNAFARLISIEEMDLPSYQSLILNTQIIKLSTLVLIPCSEQRKTPRTWNNPQGLFICWTDDLSHHLLLIQSAMHGRLVWEITSNSGRHIKHRNTNFCRFNGYKMIMYHSSQLDQSEFQFSYDWVTRRWKLTNWC